jgi:hypothetical protein
VRFIVVEHVHLENALILLPKDPLYLILERIRREVGIAHRGLDRGMPHKAVRAALELPWSNGQAEGHINRLKLVKRQMCGRAKFDLLRQRILHAA